MTETELRDAILACPDGGTVDLPNGVIDISAELSTYGKAIMLRGSGAMHTPYYPYPYFPTYGTLLKWTGASGGTLLTFGGVKGGGIEGMAIDGRGVAGTVLKICSAYWAKFRDLHVRDGVEACVDITTQIGGPAPIDTQGNLFEQISTRSVQVPTCIGMRLGSAQPGVGNTSLNNFHDLTCVHADGPGMQLNDSDGNRLFGVWMNRSSGAGYGLELNGANYQWTGHARHNVFFHLQPGAGGIVSRGTGFTNPAQDNSIHGYSRDNSSPPPVVETGSRLYWWTTGGLEGGLMASATYDPPNLPKGATAITTIPVIGAVVGDLVLPSFSLDLQAIDLAAWVSASGVVSIKFQNDTSGTVNLGSGALRVKVFKAA